jgi:Holliday junction resolvase RusA-like endonuclease
MSETLTISLPMPPSVNAAYATRKGPGRGRVATAALRNWKAAASVDVQRAISADAERPVFRGCVEIVVRLPVPPRGEPDADNRIKPVQDMLVAAGVIADDSWRYVASSAARWVYDGSLGDDCEVTVRQIAPEPATRAKASCDASAGVGKLTAVTRQRRASQRPSAKVASDASVMRQLAAMGVKVEPSRVHITGGSNP